MNEQTYRGKSYEVPISGTGLYQSPTDAAIIHVTGIGAGTLVLPLLRSMVPGMRILVVNRASNIITVARPTMFGGAPVTLGTLPAGMVAEFVYQNSDNANYDQFARLPDKTLGNKRNFSGTPGIVVASALPTYSPDCGAIYRLIPCGGGSIQYTRDNLSAYLGSVIETPNVPCSTVDLHLGNEPSTLITVETPILVRTDCEACTTCDSYDWICQGCCITADSLCRVKLYKEFFVLLDGCGEDAILGKNTKTRTGIAPLCESGSTTVSRKFGNNSISSDCYQDGNSYSYTNAYWDGPSESGSGFFEVSFSSCNRPEIFEFSNTSVANSGSIVLNFDGEDSPPLLFSDDQQAIKVKLQSMAYFGDQAGAIFIDGAGTIGSATSGNKLQIIVFDPGGDLPTPTVTTNTLNGGSVSLASSQDGNNLVINSWAATFAGDESAGNDSFSLSPSDGTDVVGGGFGSCWVGVCGFTDYIIDSVEYDCSKCNVFASRDVCDGRATRIASFEATVIGV